MIQHEHQAKRAGSHLDLGVDHLVCCGTNNDIGSIATNGGDDVHGLGERAKPTDGTIALGTSRARRQTDWDIFREKLIEAAPDMVRRRLVAVRGAEPRAGVGRRLVRCGREVTADGHKFRCNRPLCAQCGEDAADARCPRLLRVCKAARAAGYRMAHLTIVLPSTDRTDRLSAILTSARRKLRGCRERLRRRAPEIDFAVAFEGGFEIGMIPDNELHLAGGAKQRTLGELGFPAGHCGGPVWTPHIYSLLFVPPGLTVDDVAVEVRRVFRVYRQVHAEEIDSEGKAFERDIKRIARYPFKFMMRTDVLPPHRRSWDREEVALALAWSETQSTRGMRGFRISIGMSELKEKLGVVKGRQVARDIQRHATVVSSTAESMTTEGGREWPSMSSNSPTLINCGWTARSAEAPRHESQHGLRDAGPRPARGQGGGWSARRPSSNAAPEIVTGATGPTLHGAGDSDAVELAEHADDHAIVRAEDRHGHGEGRAVADLAARPEVAHAPAQQENIGGAEDVVVERGLMRLGREQHHDHLGLARPPRRERAPDVEGRPGERRIDEHGAPPRPPQPVLVDAVGGGRPDQRSGVVAGVEVEGPPHGPPEGLHDGGRGQPRVPAPGLPPSPLLAPHAGLRGEQPQQRLHGCHAAPTSLDTPDRVLRDARPRRHVGDGPAPPLARGPQAAVQGWSARSGQSRDPHVEGVEHPRGGPHAAAALLHLEDRGGADARAPREVV